MNLSDLVDHATDKKRFHTIGHYIDFCAGQSLDGIAIEAPGKREVA